MSGGGQERTKRRVSEGNNPLISPSDPHPALSSPLPSNASPPSLPSPHPDEAAAVVAGEGKQGFRQRGEIGQIKRSLQSCLCYITLTSAWQGNVRPACCLRGRPGGDMMRARGGGGSVGPMSATRRSAKTFVSRTRKFAGPHRKLY